MQGDGLTKTKTTGGILKFDDEEEEKLSLYSYLWLSEKLFLHGMSQFLSFAASQP